jgi:hydroxyacylglutathione hydrolase
MKQDTGMKFHEVLKDFFFIERGYLNGNHFVLRSERPVLVDTGYISDFPQTQTLLADLGVDLSKTRLVVNTHTHCDHVGGNAFIQDLSGCDVALHEVGKYFMDSRDDWSTWWRYYDQEARFFDCTLSIRDGDAVPIGPYEFKAIHTPGHASDGIVLYHARSKTLLSSDALWEEDMPVMTLRVEGSAALFAHEESLEKLSRLEIATVYPGHGSPFTDAKGAISRAREKLRSYFGNRERIGQDLLKRIIIYTLLMRPQADEEHFYVRLMETCWFRETVDLYFNGNYRAKYDEIMKYLTERGLVDHDGQRLFSTVKP